jgi:membrane associated rhomboid family serine protease
MSDDLPSTEVPSAERAREPVFNAPWPVAALGVLIVGGYGLQTFFPLEPVVMGWGFTPTLIAARPETLVTAIFLHGSWPHALMNAAFAVAFGAPVARFLGVDFRGVAAFVLFYLVTGILANLAFAAVHPHEAIPLVGASGAVSGLMGGTARLIAGRGWRIGPIFSPPVLTLGAATIVVNLLVVLTGLAPGLDGATIAWEAHLGGYLAGVLLIPVAARLARG